jgi:hypothetical protein
LHTRLRPDDEILHPEAGEQDVGVIDLKIDIRERPVEHHREEVFEDVLCDALSDRTGAFTLSEALEASCEESGPRAFDSVDAVPREVNSAIGSRVVADPGIVRCDARENQANAVTERAPPEGAQLYLYVKVASRGLRDLAEYPRHPRRCRHVHRATRHGPGSSYSFVLAIRRGLSNLRGDATRSRI